MAIPAPGLAGIAWMASEATILLRDLQRGRGERRDGGTRLLIFAAIPLTIFLATTLAAMRVLPLPGRELTWVIAGALVVLAGIALRQWAVWWLGAQFRTRVTVLEGHRLIDTGPYARIRHPSYTGALISAAGLGLMMASAASVLAMLAGFLVALGWRIRVEERVLAEHFGEAWSAYAVRTGALLPRLR